MQIENQIANSTSDYDKEKLQERKSKLQGGTAVIYVGANTEPEMKEKKFLLEDAVHAVRAAVVPTGYDEDLKRLHVGGVLPGGGVALIHAAKVLNDADLSSFNETKRAGVYLVVVQLKVMRQIINNAGGGLVLSLIESKIVTIICLDSMQRMTNGARCQALVFWI